ncbi:6-phosphogluconolactonase [Luteimonas aquatica]|uniref:6-phosphogluconolactonase n=1 Tax=Luteimonas aquatica TaxID=450364 RepID=UPI001F5A4769|nr:6-phosphogluconolactonase [Luteimonas aquatica]
MNARDASTGSLGDDPRLRFLAYDSVEQWAWASAVALAGELRRKLEQQPRARLLLSGGKTPAPVYEALARAPLEWQRVDVGLVDERWLQPDDPDSNARLVRESLLRDHAAAARFETMTRAGRSIEDVVAAANLHARQPADVVTLGMGEDGHTASLFPRMHGLAAALAAPQPYVAVDASGCAGAGAWNRRISLTPAGLRPAGMRLLLIRGDSKRRLLERALAGDDLMELPIRLAFTVPGASLLVHWCP